MIDVFPVSDDGREENVDLSKVDLVSSYEQSELCNSNKQALSTIMDNLVAKEQMEGSTSKKHASYATNIFWQVIIVYTTTGFILGTEVG